MIIRNKQKMEINLEKRLGVSLQSDLSVVLKNFNLILCEMDTDPAKQYGLDIKENGSRENNCGFNSEIQIRCSKDLEQKQSLVQ